MKKNTFYTIFKLKKKTPLSPTPQKPLDAAQKKYVASLKKWIQSAAKSGEEAWQMYWEHYQKDQKAKGKWIEGDEKNIDHHQSYAYWWFGQ